MSKVEELVPDIVVAESREYDEEKWRSELKKFIDEKLKPILPKAKDRAKYTSPKAMKVWERAFTHTSFDPRRDYNYEVLEFYGDRGLKYAFNKYLLRAIEPKLKESKLTALDNHYMASEFQPNYGFKMGLQKFIRVSDQDHATYKIVGDVFESFIGALDEVSDGIEDGLGMVNVYNFLVDFFRDFDFIIPRETGGSDKTDVQQIFSRFGIGEPIEEVEEKDGQYFTTIKATPEIMDILTKKGVGGFGKTFRSKVLGKGRGNTKKVATNEAYKNALETLANQGVTMESARIMKRLKDLAASELLPYIPELREKLAEAGLYAPFFYEPSKLRTTNTRTLLLKAEDREGNEFVLESIKYSSGDTNNIEYRKKLIERYIQGETKGKEREILEIERKPRRKKRTPSRKARSRPPSRRKPTPVTSSKPIKPSPPPSRKKIEPVTRRKPKKLETKARAKPPKKVRIVEKEVEEEVEETLPASIESRREELMKLTVKVLKDMLREKGLKVSGRKAELVERLL
jgi:dsRNA-specific ribonuclease